MAALRAAGGLHEPEYEGIGGEEGGRGGLRSRGCASADSYLHSRAFTHVNADHRSTERRGLMHDRFILLKRERDLGASSRLLLQNWIGLHPELGVAYRLKEGLLRDLRGPVAGRGPTAPATSADAT